MDQLHRLLKATFGHAGFRDGQEEVVRTVAEGHDALVVMPTGAGKSLCYQLPALARQGATLVVSPLIALMKDQVDSLQARGVAATCINSAISPSERQQRIQGLIEGRWKLVYVAPERFGPRFLQQLRDAQIGLLAIDEAHCVSEWGHDFRPDYLRLGDVRQQLGCPPTVALTATATLEVQRDIVRLVGIDGCRRFVQGFDRRNISLEVHECSGGPHKLGLLPALVSPGPALVYCATRKNVEKTVRSLRDAGIQAGMYHGGMEHPDRVRVQDAFMGGRVPVVVATNAFGMGVDKSDIRCIVHFDVPGSVEAYYQEIGRAGRDGAPARAVLLFHPSDRRIQEFFVRSAHPEPALVETIYDQLLAAWRQQGGEDPVVEAHRERLGASLPSDAGGHFAASACIRVLERQGWLRRVAARDRQGSVQLTGSSAQAPRGLVGRVYQAVQQRLGEHPDELWLLQPALLCRELEVDRAQLLGALRGLESRGLILYEAPSQAGAVELLRPRQPLELDRQALDHRRQFDLKKVERMVGYVHTACRRHYLLSYFGETPPYQRCGRCDACRSGKQAAQAAASIDPEQLQAMRGVLGCIQRLRGDYTPGMVAKVLTGSTDRAVRALELDRLVTHGLLSSWTVAEVEALIEALVHADLLERRYVTRPVQGTQRTYAVVGLTDAGHQQVLGRGGPPTLELPGAVVSALARQSRGARGGRSSSASAASSVVQVSDDLLSYLRDVRRQLAQAADVPAYVVASNRTLVDIAARRPDTHQAMLQVHGMGPVRFQRFGRPLLDAVQAWSGG